MIHWKGVTSYKRSEEWGKTPLNLLNKKERRAFLEWVAAKGDG